MGKLTEKTWIPLGVAIIAIGGGSMWLTTIYLNGNAVASQVAQIKIHQDAMEAKQDSINDLKTGIAVLQSQMGSLQEQMTRVEKKLDRVK